MLMYFLIKRIKTKIPKTILHYTTNLYYKMYSNSEEE